LPGVHHELALLRSLQPVTSRARCDVILPGRRLHRKQPALDTSSSWSLASVSGCGATARACQEVMPDCDIPSASAETEMVYNGLEVGGHCTLRLPSMDLTNGSIRAIFGIDVRLHTSYYCPPCLWRRCALRSKGSRMRASTGAGRVRPHAPAVAKLARLQPVQWRGLTCESLAAPNGALSHLAHPGSASRWQPQTCLCRRSVLSCDQSRRQERD